MTPSLDVSGISAGFTPSTRGRSFRRSSPCAWPSSTPASIPPTRSSQNQIVDGRSFVASDWESDTNGHGTFVAGEIAATLNNGRGIAGMGFSVDLLIAKIVRSDGTISPVAEARAIHWAVDHDARVINMSFGGVRDPSDPSQDTYSRLEAEAVQYAVDRGVLVVAAVGNADGAPTEPGATPAIRRRCRTLSASARCARRDRAGLLEPRRPLQRHRGARRGDPLHAAGRADGELATWLHPSGVLGLRADRVPPRRGHVVLGAARLGRSRAPLRVVPVAAGRPGSNLLTRSSADANPDTGCIRCTAGRDAMTGWGQLDIGSAVDALDDQLPAADRYEGNDQVANAASLWGRRGQRIHGTIDYWDDRQDVYKVRMRAGQQIAAKLRGSSGKSRRGRAASRRLLLARMRTL